MVSSNAATVADYLDSLEPGRRDEIARVRETVRAAIPPGYDEVMRWGMITWEVPLAVSGPTYNKQPLAYAALAAQKNSNSLYLNCAYASAERTAALKDAATAAGKKLDMGKSCIRFKRADDLPLDAIRDEIASMGPREFAAFYEAARKGE